MAGHNELGKQGEAAAVKYLEAKGHKILCRNYRYSRAEIDIVSMEKGIMIFTEVKTRSSNQYGFPEEYVDNKKIRLLKEAAENYMYEHHHDGELRFDIVSVIIANGHTDIHHIEDAFFHEDGNY